MKGFRAVRLRRGLRQRVKRIRWQALDSVDVSKSQTGLTKVGICPYFVTIAIRGIAIPANIVLNSYSRSQK